MFNSKIIRIIISKINNEIYKTFPKILLITSLLNILNELICLISVIIGILSKLIYTNKDIKLDLFKIYYIDWLMNNIRL